MAFRTQWTGGRSVKLQREERNEWRKLLIFLFFRIFDGISFFKGLNTC